MSMKLEFYQDLHKKTVVLGGDHHAKLLTDFIEKELMRRGMEVERVPFSEDTKDYISQTAAVAERVSQNPDIYCGIVGCKNGFGVTTVANIYKNVFATRCDNQLQAIDARKVNYSNVLTFGAVFVSEDEMKAILDNWFSTNFELSEKNVERLTRLFELMKA